MEMMFQSVVDENMKGETMKAPQKNALMDSLKKMAMKSLKN